MSPWQLKRQLAWWLAQQRWSETPQGLVISGGGLVTEEVPGNFRPGDREVDGPVAIGLMTDGGIEPFALVSDDLITWDGESLARLDQVVLLARIAAGGGAGTPTSAVGRDPGGKGNTTAAGYDTHGLNQVTGALRASPNGQGQSQGRDVDELLARVAELVGETGFVDSVHGFQGRLLEAGRMTPDFGVQLLDRAVIVEALNATPSNYYHPGFRLRASTSGSYKFTIDGTNGGGAGVIGSTIYRVTADGVDYDFEVGDGVGTGDFANATSNSQNAQNLRDAINARAGLNTKVTAAASQTFIPPSTIHGFITFTLTGAATLALSVVNMPSNTDFGHGIASNPSVALSWKLPPMRFDTLAGVLRRSTNPGGPAPATPTDGTSIPITGGALGTAATDAGLAGGSYYYSYFMSYAETPAGQLAQVADRYSVPISVLVSV